jgi:glutaconate CoA-transferase subunit B
VSAPATPQELQAILLARDFRPDDRVVQIGANLPTARAGALLAGLSTHPDLRVVIGLSVDNLATAATLPAVHELSFHARSAFAGEAVMDQGTVFDDVASPDVFFVGGLQVDRRGNVNLVGIPDADGGWKMHGPGAVALATMSTNCRGYYILMPAHSPRVFVERVASITALGDRRRREELQLPGGGPRLLFSPLGVFDFNDDGDMRVVSLHPGTTVEDVNAATGFELDVPGDVPITPSPTPAELGLLRERVDPSGSLRTT